MKIPALWRTSVMTSCVHAARQLAVGRALNDARLADALTSAAMRLDDAWAESSDGGESGMAPDRAELWLLALELSLDDPAATELVARMGSRLAADSRIAAAWQDRLAELLTLLRDAFLKVQPRIAHELPLRVRPLREQWEARGPGFLARAARVTRLSLASLDSSVVLVHPVLGGGGVAHFGADAIHFEAVLTNANGRLPESLRLGWLLMQLAAWPLLDSIPVSRRRRLVAAATLPAAIAAGQYVELAPPDPNLVLEAAAAWLSEPVPPVVAARLVADSSQVERSPIERSWRDLALTLDALWT